MHSEFLSKHILKRRVGKTAGKMRVNRQTSRRVVISVAYKSPDEASSDRDTKTVYVVV